ncbi:MAG: hypothetical protein RL497_1357, partial [Pseudomonadota bacterium]
MIGDITCVSESGLEMTSPPRPNIHNFNTDIARKVFREGAIEIRWENNHSLKKYRAPKPIKRILPCPTPDLKKMVILSFGQKTYLLSNAIVLNDDGVEICNLEIPKRLSKLQISTPSSFNAIVL